MAKKTNEARDKQTVEPSDVGAVPHDLVPVGPPQGELLAPHMNEAAKAFLGEVQGPRNTPQSIPFVTIDHKGGGFILPSGEVVTEVSGYPIYYFQTRRLYKKPPAPGQKGQPPDCWSADMVVPHRDAADKQNATCAGCPMNEWQTARDGRGKMCATQTWVFLLNPDFGAPPIGVLVVPPSSIRALLGTRNSAGYFGRAAAKHGVYEIVWTNFRLEQMGDQVTYCVVVPGMGPPAPLERAREIAKVRNDFIAMMDAARGLTPDVVPGAEEG